MILPILLVCCFAPGFFLVRRLRWSPMEKLAGGVGLSAILLWLAVWLLYLAGANGAAGCFAIVGACVVLGALSWRDIVALFRTPRTRQCTMGFACLLVWTLVALSTIRHYSGAGWAGDWLEQFNRSLFFLHHFPKDSEMFGGYRITSRPPGLNVIAAFAMAMFGDRFQVFQETYTFLNLLLFLPCCLMLPVFGRVRKGAIAVLAAIFACSPWVMVNATYTGAKSFAAFYVVLGIAFYLTGWRKRDRVRTTAAFLFFAAGLLAHYSAAPYCVFFAAHYLISVFPKRTEKWKELTGIAVAAGVVLVAWFGWTIATYGLQGTVMAPVNTSVTYGPKDESGYLVKYLANLFDTTVPHILRSSSLMHAFDQPNPWGYLRDNTFVVYQTNLIFAMGIVGGPLVVWFLIRALRRPETPMRTFWIALIAFTVAVGLLVVGERDHYGVAHLTLLSMFALGLTLLANRFFTSRTVAWLIVAGCAIDFGLGVFLQTSVEHMENTPGRAVFATLTMNDAGIDFPAPPDSLSQPAWSNWFRKHQFGLSEKWLTEMDKFRPGDPAVEPAKAAIRPTLDQAIKDEQRVWHGWYARHGGEVRFLGDELGDTGAMLLVMIALAGVALWQLARALPKPALPTREAPRPRKPDARRARRS